MAENDETAPTSPQTPAGWYQNPDGGGTRYWDGTGWTENFHPGTASIPTRKELLWALALGFGAAGGVVGFLSIPIAAFYFPLGFGTAGAALCIAALTQEGDSPWYAAVAVIASVAALGLGITAYNDFDSAQGDLRDAQDQLDDILR